MHTKIRTLCARTFTVHYFYGDYFKITFMEDICFFSLLTFDTIQNVLEQHKGEYMLTELQFSLKKQSISRVLPWRSTVERLACGSEYDIAGDDGEHAPCGQEAPPVVKLNGKVKRNHPHLQ